MAMTKRLSLSWFWVGWGPGDKRDGGGTREAGALLGQSASQTGAPSRTPASLGQSRRKSRARKGGLGQGAKGKKSPETESPLPMHSPVVQGWGVGWRTAKAGLRAEPPGSITRGSQAPFCRDRGQPATKGWAGESEGAKVPLEVIRGGGGRIQWRKGSQKRTKQVLENQVEDGSIG